MKPIQHREPRNIAASEMADTSASHFVPLGHVAEGINGGKIRRYLQGKTTRSDCPVTIHIDGRDVRVEGLA